MVQLEKKQKRKEKTGWRDVPGLLKLLDRVGKERVLLVLVEESALLERLVKLRECSLDERCDASVVGEQQSAHVSTLLDVRASAAERYLDARGAPRNKVGQLALPDSLQALVNLRWLNPACIVPSRDDVEDAHVAAVAAGIRADHHILRLQQPAHHIKHRGLAHRLGTLHLIAGERSIASHQKVKPRRRDERSKKSDKIIVHVARVAQCARRGRHNGRNQLIGLRKRRVCDVEAVGRNAIKRRIIKDHLAGRKVPGMRYFSRTGGNNVPHSRHSKSNALA